MTSLSSAASPLVLIADPRVLAVPVNENQDPMLDLRQQSALCYGPSPEIPDNQDYYYMRKTVYEKILQAQAHLPKGIRFCLYEAYRSIELQQQIFDTHCHDLRKANPEWDESTLFLECIKMVSPVKNQDGSPNIPPHATGAAFDIYLINDKNQVLDMGIHPKDWLLDISGHRSETQSSIISKEAQSNRRLMSELLEAVGFVNYPTEYWHWSYGDRYWAYHKQQPAALYGLWMRH